MSDGDDFEQLMSRVRNGDEQAAAELVRQCQPEIRRFIRFRLSSPHLRRFVDSLDVCQSVLANFFVGLEGGRFQLDDPDQLRRLLLTMARNKLYDRARREHALRRDGRRAISGVDEALNSVADHRSSPSQQLAAEELSRLLHEELSPAESQLLEARLSGKSWAELAVEMGEGPEGLRKRLTRSLDRAAKKLGLSAEFSHE